MLSPPPPGEFHPLAFRLPPYCGTLRCYDRCLQQLVVACDNRKAAPVLIDASVSGTKPMTVDVFVLAEQLAAALRPIQPRMAFVWPTVASNDWNFLELVASNRGLMHVYCADDVRAGLDWLVSQHGSAASTEQPVLWCDLSSCCPHTSCPLVSD